MKLSIITINYNNSDGLRKTIESVVNQTYRDYEYIIIDGGSTDESVEVIKEHADKIDYWVSEKDKGIYNAMNKGVQVAHGKYCQFLNSGDVLLNNHVLEDVFHQGFSSDIVCGHIVTNGKRGMTAPQDVTMNYFLRGSLPHPSSFIKKDLFDVHAYDERFKIAGDWEFFVYHLIERNASYQAIDIEVADFDTTGISSVTPQNERDFALRCEVLERILPPRIRNDYAIFRGEKDEYNRLFYTISHSKFRMRIYSMVVVVLKVLMCNKGWIQEFKWK